MTDKMKNEMKVVDTFDVSPDCIRTVYEYKNVFCYVDWVCPRYIFGKTYTWGWLDLLFPFESWPFEKIFLDNAMAYCDNAYGCPVFSDDHGGVEEQMITFINEYKDRIKKSHDIFDVFKCKCEVSIIK